MVKLKVGVVGTGYLGKFHAQKYAQLDEAELVGIADIDKKVADSIAKDLSTTAYYDYKDLIGKVDAVSIVVPTSYHYIVSKFFLENGIDILLEKPITSTLEQADELIKIAENKNLIIQVGHLERFNKAVVGLKKHIVEKPRFIESERLSTFRGRGIDVSIILDLMIHDIDLILNIVNSEILSINASGAAVVSKYDDIANARIEFKNGCAVILTASRISAYDARKIRVFQRDGYASVDFMTNEMNVIKKTKTDKNSVIPGMDIKHLTFPKGDALLDEIKAFVETVKSRKEPEVTGLVARNALDIALRVIKQVNITNDRYFGSN